jgi:hypothetical protein
VPRWRKSCLEDTSRAWCPRGKHDSVAQIGVIGPLKSIQRNVHDNGGDDKSYSKMCSRDEVHAGVVDAHVREEVRDADGLWKTQPRS